MTKQFCTILFCDVVGDIAIYMNGEQKKKDSWESKALQPYKYIGVTGNNLCLDELFVSNSTRSSTVVNRLYHSYKTGMYIVSCA